MQTGPFHSLPLKLFTLSRRWGLDSKMALKTTAGIVKCANKPLLELLFVFFRVPSNRFKLFQGLLTGVYNCITFYRCLP